jgi:hypothetical protein
VSAALAVQVAGVVLSEPHPEGDGANRALDFAGVIVELARLGITQSQGVPFSERQVRRLADTGKLPFFKGPDGRRRIMLFELRTTVLRWQAEASRRAMQQRSEAERARRPKGRG